MWAGGKAYIWQLGPWNEDFPNFVSLNVSDLANVCNQQTESWFDDIMA